MITRRNALKLGAAGLVVPSAAGMLRPAGRAPKVSADESTTVVGQFRGNAGHTGEMPGPAPDYEQALIIRWIQDIDGYRNDHPVLSGNRLITWDERILQGRDVRTGEPAWTYEAEQAFRWAVADAERVYATSRYFDYYGTPAVYNDAVRAFTPATGEELWRYSGTADLLVIADDTLICWGDGQMWALDATTGDEIWRGAVGEEDSLSGEIVVSGQVMIVAGGWEIRSYSLETGDELWRMEMNVPGEFAAGRDGMFFRHAWEGPLSAYDAEQGQEVWRSSGPNIWTRPAISADRVFYGAADNSFVALDASTGNELWRHVGESPMNGSPVIVGDDVWFGEEGGAFYIANLETGEIRWQHSVLDVLGNQSMFPLLDRLSVDFSWDMEMEWPEFPIIADGLAIFRWGSYAFCISNMPETTLIEDTALRGAPSASGVERGSAKRGDVVNPSGGRDMVGDELWLEVTSNGVTGWIPASAIDPATMPPEGEVIYITQP